MSYGFQVTNNSNILQIDDSYSNFAIYSEGYWSALTYPKQVTLPNIQGARLLVSMPHNAEITLDSPNNTPGSTVTISCAVALNYKIVIPSSYYVDSAFGYGLNIYKPDGTLAFSSNLNYISVIDSLFFTHLESTNYKYGTLVSYAGTIFVDITAAYPAGHFTVSYEDGRYRDEDFKITLTRYNSEIYLYTEIYSITLDILSGLAAGNSIADTGDRNFIFFQELP